MARAANASLPSVPYFKLRHYQPGRRFDSGGETGEQSGRTRGLPAAGTAGLEPAPGAARGLAQRWFGTAEISALEISLTNDLREIAAVAEKIDEFCAARDVPPAVAYAVNLSLDELLTNTINYGCDDGARHRIDISVRMDGSALVVEITDDARPFDPSEAAPPDTDMPIEDRPIGGLGIHFVRETMDGFRYCRRGKHNVVTLTKNVDAGDTEDAGAAP